MSDASAAQIEVSELGALLPPLSGPIDPQSYKKSLESKVKEAKVRARMPPKPRKSTSLNEIVKANVSRVLEGLKVASSVSAEVSALKGDLSDVNKRIEDPNVGLEPLCRTHSEDKQNLVHAIRTKSLAIDLVKHLSLAKDKLKVYDDKIAANNLLAASEALAAASSALHSARVLILGPSDSQNTHQDQKRFPKVYQLLRDQWRTRTESLRVTISSAVDRIVDFSESNNSQFVLTIRKSIDGRLSLFELFKCVSSCGLVDHACASISSTIDSFVSRLTAENFDALALDSEQETSTTTLLKLRLVTEPSTKSAATKLDSPAQLASTRRLLKNTVALFTFLWKHFAVAEAVQGAEDVWRRIAYHNFATAQRNIIKHCLAAYVPDQSTDLIAYQDIVKETDLFETQLLDTQVLPRTVPTGSTADDPRALSNFAKQVDVHFAQKRRKQILDTVREVLLADNALLESVYVEERTHGSGHSLFEFPRCRVRKAAVELFQIADRTMQDAAHQTRLGAESMYQCVRAIFDLYRALVPVQIGSKSSEVPILALLVHNDCMYLAHQLMTLAQRHKSAISQLQNHPDITFLDLVLEFREMGENYFFSYMQAHRREIVELLSSTKGLDEMSRPERINTVETALRKTTHWLVHMAKLSREVLPLVAFYQSFGALLNVAATWMIDRFQELTDIGSDEVPNLSKAFKTFHPLENIFTTSEDAPTGTDKSRIYEFVPSWAKMKKVSIMLDGKMIDLVQKFMLGEFPEFSNHEMIAFLVAVYEDNSLRREQVRILRSFSS